MYFYYKITEHCFLYKNYFWCFRIKKQKNKFLIINIKDVSSCMAKELDCGLEVSKFELQSRY